MTPQPDRPRRFPNKRELARLLVFFGGLVVVMTFVLGLDLTPGLALKAGDLAPSDVVAPRAQNFTNDLLTAQAKQAARDNVDPQYDYTTERAITIAAEQLSAFTRRVAPIEAAFVPETSVEERQALLEGVLPGLNAEVRDVLVNLEPRRWSAVRTEAARVLDTTERNELRDTQVAEVRQRLSAQMAGGLSDKERSLAAAIIGPLLVPNSSFSETLTDQERDRAEAAVAPVVVETVAAVWSA